MNAARAVDAPRARDDLPLQHTGNQPPARNVLFGSVFALLALTAALLYRRRAARSASIIDDDIVRAIEERGSVEVDEPLDLETIREEERRFLEEEEWDEAEEW